MPDEKVPFPRLGCQLSIGKGLDVTSRNAAKMEVETFQVFLRNPRGSGFRVWGDREIQQFKETINKHRIYPVVAHIPYIVNPASPRDDLYELAGRVITEDLNRCDIIEAPYLVLHPGSRGDATTEEAIDRLIALVNNILDGNEGKAVLLIETMSGMGKEICSNFDEMKQLWQGIKRKDRLGICFDSCHLFAAGYDVATTDGLSRLLDEIDSKVGIRYLKVVHINDSLRELGSRIDRHAPIGKGHIGVVGITNIMKNSVLKKLPFILETPTATIEQDLQVLRDIRASIQQD
ncbi:MAG: deoxyribonuclease IV [Syntrophomonadaceae bacterium]|nr:deoxyribonuclease IV [Syntrophomonadaceae bacterium]